MITTLFVVLLLIAITAVATAIALVVTLVLLRVPKPGLRQIYTCSLVTAILLLVVGRALYLTYDRGVLLRTLTLVAGLVAAVAVPPILLRIQFHTSWSKSIGASLLWLAGIAGVSLVSIAFIAVVSQRAYKVPTNAMAPAINGLHRVGRCRHCDGEVFISAPADSNPDEELDGICSSCGKYGPANEIAPNIVRGDRILASPFLQPDRWSIVTYYPPSDPAVLYVHRIVGLPGESVLLKDGQLWINGVPQTPPPDFIPKVYAGTAEMLAQNEMAFGLEFGTGEEPCQLGDDECFVLGDNTFRSFDSRYFGPVKMDQVTSVVTMRYWPPSRMKVLRNSSQSQR